MYPWQRDSNTKALTLKLLQRNNLHFCLRITNKKTSTWCEQSDPSVTALILHLWLTRQHSVGTTPTDGSCVPESLKRALVKTLSISRVTAHSSHGNGGKQRRRFPVCMLLSLFVNSATVSASQILRCSEALMMWKNDSPRPQIIEANQSLLSAVCFSSQERFPPVLLALKSTWLSLRHSGEPQKLPLCVKGLISILASLYQFFRLHI